VSNQAPDRPHEVYKLKVPIEASGEKIDTVYVKRPKGKEMRLFPSEVKVLGDLHPFLAKICGLTAEQVDELDAADYKGISDVVQGLVSGFPPTGPGA
jgi:Phage tail assembly chaperone proteins, E, or 41 or 14